MQFNDNIEALNKTISRYFKLVYNTKNILSHDAKLIIYNSYIFSIISYHVSFLIENKQFVKHLEIKHKDQ